ncbi:unnamed protein product [Lampetra fluviatilis]
MVPRWNFGAYKLVDPFGGCELVLSLQSHQDVGVRKALLLELDGVDVDLQFSKHTVFGQIIDQSVQRDFEHTCHQLDDEGRAQKTEPHYLNFKATVQHSTSPYECPDSQLDSAPTNPGMDSPYVDLTIQ